MTVETGSASIRPLQSMPRSVEIDTPCCASWLERMFDIASLRTAESTAHVSSESGALFQFAVDEAGRLTDDDLSAAVEGVYRQLLGELESRGLHPVRIWNYLPGIVSSARQAKHRYMVFNAGRYAAYERCYGGAEHFAARIPTASGTGTGSERFVLQCYASVSPGEPLENIRQIPAYRYSQAYGDFPPCFTRATIVTSEQLGLGRPPRRALLVGGTASIRGEASCHVGRVDLQLKETLRNLSALVTRGLELDRASSSPLEHFVDLRVYHPRPQDRAFLRDAVERCFPQLSTLEFVHADLCRPELLVEIEGTAARPAELSSASGR